MKINKILNLILVAIIILIVFVIFLIFNSNQYKATLELYGLKEMVVYQGEEYQESGYLIVKQDNDNNNYYVNIVNNLNVNIVGNYVIKYQLLNNNKIVDEVMRRVEVITNPLSNVKITLNGNDITYHWLNEPYLDKGAIAYNGNNDITNNLQVTGNVNVNRVGTYQLKYSININGIEKSIIRTVKVVDLKVNENINYNKSQIQLSVSLEDFYYATLPNNGISYSSVITYPITKNGIYEFTIYNKYGLSKKHIVNITDYDKKAPTGTCLATISNGNTSVKVSATDENGIEKYVYNNNSYQNSSFTLSGELNSVVVTVYDKFNNSTIITCSVKRLFDNNMDKIVSSNIYAPCNNDWSKHNKELNEAINQIGYKTRDAVAYAATYLAGLEYKIAYSWGGKSLDIGLNPKWGCEVEVTQEVCSKKYGDNRCMYGMDCTGYTAWAFAQAGFDRSILRTSSQSTGMWGNFNAGTHKYSFSGNQDKVHLIKPGDIVHTEGHVGIVIGTSDTQLKVANMVGGVIITYLNKSNGQSINGQHSFDNFVLFDDFFTMYGIN